MRLVVWNSQGAKWDQLWNYVAAAIGGGAYGVVGGDSNVVGLVAEAGWAPWMPAGSVSINNCYEFDSSKPYPPGFCAGVASKRQYKAGWIPWVGNLDALKTNTRCSLGAVSACTSRVIKIEVLPMIDWMKRPVVRVSVGKNQGNGVTIEFTILMVHLISGVPFKAQEEIDALTAAARQMIPEGTAAIIVGDMNIDAQTTQVALPVGWRGLGSGVPTQQSGGELDYGLLYDPRGQYRGATIQVLERYKSGANLSDHSAMMFNIPLIG